MPPTAIPRFGADRYPELVLVTFPVPRIARLVTLAEAMVMAADTLMFAELAESPTRRVRAVTKSSSVSVRPRSEALSAAPKSMFLPAVVGARVTIRAEFEPVVSAAPMLIWSAVTETLPPVLVSAAVFANVPANTSTLPELVSPCETEMFAVFPDFPKRMLLGTFAPHVKSESTVSAVAKLAEIGS